MEFNTLLNEIRNCRLCENHLPLEPRPVLSVSIEARIMIIGQAPGTKVHATGIPWNDASGDRLRDWLLLDRKKFYRDKRIGIVPMGFCYPGKGASGDLPPRPECAPKWHEPLFQHLKQIEIILLIGRYAIDYYQPFYKGKSISDILRNFDWQTRQIYIPLVHPSPRNRIWLRNNEWFENEYIPKLQSEIYKSGIYTDALKF